MLLQRILTALVLIPLFVAAVFYLPTQWFVLLLAALCLVGVWEWSCMFKLCFSLLAAATLLGALAGYLSPILTIAAISLGTIWWVYISLTLPYANKLTQQRTHLAFFEAMLLFIPALCAIIFLHGSEPNGPWLVMYLFILIWIADSAAYFSGRAFGKRKLAPTISPGKTVEGLFGGLAAVFLFALIIGIVWRLSLPNQIALWALSVTVAAISVIGDLFMSRAKRAVGVKDSGHILPGHGGVLDRIDSLLAAAPGFALGLYFLRLT